jgi:hypothetical protein
MIFVNGFPTELTNEPEEQNVYYGTFPILNTVVFIAISENEVGCIWV